MSLWDVIVDFLFAKFFYTLEYVFNQMPNDRFGKKLDGIRR